MHGMLLSVVLLAAGCRLPSGASEPTVEVKVTQKYLVPVCLDGAPVNGDRHWRLTLSEHTLAFTMRNEPRHSATPESAPGFAVVRFIPQAEHRYEIEVRAEATSFSSRAWNRGEWKPVVRDRTTDEIVNSEPEWHEETCR